MKRIQKLASMMNGALVGLALVLLMAGCADMLQPPGTPEAKAGTVTLTIGGGARTALPSTDQFTNITLSFAGSPALPDADMSADGSTTVSLPPGSWTVTTKAYADAESPVAYAINTLGWNGTSVSWDGETITGNPRIALTTVGIGLGTLEYSVTIPNGITLAGTGSRIRIEQNGAALASLTDDDFTNGVHAISATETETVSLAAGSYLVDILLENSNNDTAVYQESALILPGLITKITTFAPVAEDFIDSEARAAMTTVGEFDKPLESNIIVGDLVTSGTGYTLGISAPNQTGTVNFTLTKTENQSVTIGGTDRTSVSAVASAEGSSASDILAIFKVDTTSISEKGGEKSFTLTVQTEGKTGVDIAVTVTVLGSFGVYIDSGTGGAEILTKVEDDSITDLGAALAFLAEYAENNTKYVVLVNDDYEMGESFASKVGSTGVQITLRGIWQNRDIYWNEQETPAVLGVFQINAGTTLVLDNNITLGTDVEKTLNDKNLVYIAGGEFEMLSGSKISHITPTTTTTSYPVISIVENGVFKMKGGSIEQNTVNANIIYLSSGEFVMESGATISGNTVTPPVMTAGSNHNGVYQQVVGDTGKVGVVSVVGGKFTMHGGEITNNLNIRGVFFQGDTTTPIEFTMSGGEISRNGTQKIIRSDGNEFGIIGAGVFATGGIKITMTGGAIINNGDVAAPGSGLFYDNRASSTNLPVTLLLNGPVNFSGNTIGLSYSCLNSKKAIFLGQAFVADSYPIQIDLAPIAASARNTQAYMITYFNAQDALQTDPDFTSGNIADLVGNFTLNKCVFLLNTYATYALTDWTDQLDMAITTEGKTSVAAKSQ
jgi:hypothetical protein